MCVVSVDNKLVLQSSLERSDIGTMAEQLITNADCQLILRKKLKTTKMKYLSHVIKPLSENTEGFLGQHLKLEVTYELDGNIGIAKYFVKSEPKKLELQKETIEMYNIFEKEIYFYDKLFKEFERYGFDVSFAPICYLTKGSETMVLQDLHDHGFRLASRATFFDMATSKCLLKSLAKMHGAALVLEEEKSKEFGRTYRLNEERPDLFKEIFYDDNETGLCFKFIESSEETAFILIDLLDEDESFKEHLKKLLRKYKPNDQFDLPFDSRKTLGHGDLWTNNMLFQYENDVPVRCCLVDYQISRYFYPSYDVMLALYQNTSADFRKDHMDEMIEYYYESLSGILESQGYSIQDILPLQDYHTCIKKYEYPARFHAFAEHTFTYLPMKTLNSSTDNNDNFSDLLFKARPKMCAQAFGENEQCRKVLTDDLYELYEFLKKLDSS